MAQHLSDSKAQSDIELQMCSYLENLHPDWHQVDWSDLSVGLEFAAKVKPDAVWRDDKGRIFIAECYVRVGVLKPGHRRKIASDILKLISIRNELDNADPPRLLLIVPDELGPQLEGDDWLSLVIRKDITLVKIPLNDEQHLILQEAVLGQSEGQAHKANLKDKSGLNGYSSINPEDEFHHAMIGVADYANQHQFGFRFRQMIDQFGAVNAAKRLLARHDIQTGLIRLWELQALDKSMEALVIQDRFRCLFNEAEIQEARRRLTELGYFFTN